MATKIIIRAAGFMRTGSERNMVDNYINRAHLLARQTGFLSVEEQTVDIRSCKNQADETRKLLDPIPKTALCIILDERGKAQSSRDISQTFEKARNDGQSGVYLIIGGADGFDQNSLPKGLKKWALGPQTWPHKLVRVMIAEQTYRALSILAGTPYHRD